MTPIGDRLFGATFDETHVGTKYQTPGRTITEADVVNFAMLSGDWYPLHTDVEYARKSMFGQRIAHGLLTLSVVSGMCPLVPGELEAFYGIDNLRFRGPVFFGDTVSATFEISEKNAKNPTMGTIRVGFTVVNQRDEVVVQGDWLFAQRRSEEPGSEGSNHPGEHP